MIEISFTKMHGLGNDFILINCIEQPEIINLELEDLSKTLCHRRFGIGADQILLLCPSEIADFNMKIYNADGSEVEMCGNGIRCLAKYIWDRGLSKKDILEIETLAGIIKPERAGDMVKVDMGEPILEPEKIPVAIESPPPIIDYPLQIEEKNFKITCISMGNPHAVIFLNEEVSDFPVSTYGPLIERHPIFPNKTNVEFVNVQSRTRLSMRVWERGSGETMACGTGASAVGVAAMLKGLTERNISINLLGGDLLIHWHANNHVYMTGPAVEVFQGIVHYSAAYRKDRRRHPRRSCSIAIEFSEKGKSRSIPCTCIDISESGMGITSDYELEIGQIISFKIKDVQHPKSAVVIWSKKDQCQYRAGLMFI
ncbi:diaminopimelate epimerase [hot springs metagenome]|uniref:diaminopimelate epimerase n=1 Tax=hot springs metagenome TaxID=433727 RepID=A0A5J4KTS5_9ZZZZ